ncbi:MAG TPA: CsgG/HfaB family protein [Candidatus Limnocylindria bacterium]|nr:CsgG/HfaB family protein [Candidatus Limnocylindria bacterium]
MKKMGFSTYRTGMAIVLAYVVALSFAGCATTPPVTGPSDSPSAPAAVMPKVEPVAPIVMQVPKKRVAVVKFQEKSAYGRGRLGEAVQDILMTELSKSGLFILVSRGGDLDLVLDEQDLGMSGVVKEGTGAKSGEVLGLNAIVTGAVSQFGVKQKSATYLIGASKTQTAEATIDVRVVDATTGQVIFAESGTGVHEESSTQVLGIGGAKGYDETLEGKALRAAVSQFIDNLIQRMEAIPWSGKIAAVDGGEIAVNAGQKTGLVIGYRLRVFGEGQEVIDPDTKLSLGRKPGREKGEIVVTGFFGEDAAICRQVSGEGFAVNDIVKLAR